MISQGTVDQIRKVHDILPIYQEYVSLKRKGRNYIGLCPFHSEKSPSFVVSPDKRIFHCFGCHESGDHISFVMKVDNLSFAEAIHHIGQKCGITVEEDERESSPYDKDREHLQTMLVSAREAFQNAFPGSVAESYIKERGVNDDSINTFHIGYCPADLDLLSLFRSEGHSDDMILKTGLFYTSQSGEIGSRFKHRLIFPILDHRGRTVGFSGRIMDPNSTQAKYVNSEDTLLFNKRRIVYGLDVAKRFISKEKSVLLMEGYMDVIMAHQHGFKHVIATMGTALTPDHGKLLKRFCSTLYMCMDSDDAGQTAIERSFDVLKPFDMSIYVVPLPEKDPADLLHHQGSEAFQHCIDQHQPMVLFLADRGLKQLQPGRIEELASLSGRLVDIIRLEKDPIVQSHYLKEIASKLGVEEKLLHDKLKNNSIRVITNVTNPKSFSQRGKYVKAEESLLYLLAINKEHRSHIINDVDDTIFLTDEYKSLFNIIRSSNFSKDELLEHISDTDLRGTLARLMIEQQDKGEPDGAQWLTYVNTLKQHQVESRISDIREQLKSTDLNENETKALLEELGQLVRETQGGTRNG